MSYFARVCYNFQILVLLSLLLLKKHCLLKNKTNECHKRAAFWMFLLSIFYRLLCEQLYHTLHTSKEEIAWLCWLIIVVTFSVCFGKTSENLMKRWMLHPAGYASHIQKLCFSDLSMAFSIPFLLFPFFSSFCIDHKQPVFDKTKK